jgi:hypothetical protein
MSLRYYQFNAGEESAFIKAFLYRTADGGADGVILYRGNVVAGEQGMGGGAKGAFGFLDSPTQDALMNL